MSLTCFKLRGHRFEPRNVGYHIDLWNTLVLFVIARYAQRKLLPSSPFNQTRRARRSERPRESNQNHKNNNNFHEVCAGWEFQSNFSDI